MPVLPSPLTVPVCPPWFVFKGMGVDLNEREKKKEQQKTPQQTLLCPTQLIPYFLKSRYCQF